MSKLGVRLHSERERRVAARWAAALEAALDPDEETRRGREAARLADALRRATASAVLEWAEGRGTLGAPERSG